MTKLFAISGHTGAGKNTLINRVLGLDNELIYFPSVTTREIKTGEQEGINYFYRTVSQFNQMIENNEFIEYSEHYGSFYGSPEKPYLEALEQDLSPIVDINVDGAMSFKRRFGDDCVTVFVKTPSTQIRHKRLELRDGELAVEREKAVEYEKSLIGEFDYMLTNDDLESAVDILESIVINENYIGDEKRKHLIKPFNCVQVELLTSITSTVVKHDIMCEEFRELDQGLTSIIFGELCGIEPLLHFGFQNISYTPMRK
ncbi:guanylate kinase [Paenibacillus sp. DS2015]|uniref:guanylate kinase n=1 Tax=Paenibacillus sp. DS2015 TaxID=3373917 RepID=UPI003D1D539A